MYVYLRSRELLQQFSQNLVLYVFQAREDDLDRSQPCKVSIFGGLINEALDNVFETYEI